VTVYPESYLIVCYPSRTVKILVKKRRNIISVLPPRSTNVNGQVERAQSTDTTQEFHEVPDRDFQIAELE